MHYPRRHLIPFRTLKRIPLPGRTPSRPAHLFPFPPPPPPSLWTLPRSAGFRAAPGAECGEAAPKGGPLFVGHAFVGFSSPPTLLRETLSLPLSLHALVFALTYINGDFRRPVKHKPGTGLYTLRTVHFGGWMGCQVGTAPRLEIPSPHRGRPPKRRSRPEGRPLTCLPRFCKSLLPPSLGLSFLACFAAARTSLHLGYAFVGLCLLRFRPLNSSPGLCSASCFQRFCMPFVCNVLA